MKSRLQLSKNCHPSRHGPVYSNFDKILKNNRIALQAYHGRLMVGNHCNKYLQKKVIVDIASSVSSKTHELTKSLSIRSKAENVAMVIRHANELYASNQKSISHCRQ